MRLVNAAKASPHAKFYNLSTDYNDASNYNFHCTFKVTGIHELNNHK